MNRPPPTDLLRYGSAVLGVVLATFARLALDPVLGDLFPFATLFFAVLIAAGYGGRGPALLATVLGAAASARFLLPPRGGFAVHGVENQAGLALFVAVSLGIAVLGGTLRNARRRAEEGAATAVAGEERLRVTLSSIGDAVIATDAAGRVRLMNPVAETLTGWRQGDAEGRPLAEVFRIFHEKTRRPAANPAARALREGTVAGLANRTLLITRDGTETAIDDSAAPIKDPRGNTLGVVLVFRDATGRRRMEAALRESEARLRFLLDATGIGQWELDLTTDTSVRSLRHDQIFGYDAPLPAWGYEKFLNEHVHPDDRAAVDRAFREAGPDRERDFECRIIRADRAVRWIWVKSVVLADRGTPVRMLGLVMDVTDRKRTEERLRAATDEAEAANRAKTQFLAVLSHELRTPLNPIMLATTALLEQPAEFEEIRPTLEMIRQNVNLQARLIDDLLDVMRIVRGKMPLHWEVADTHRLIHQAIQICRSEVFGSELRLELDLAAAHHHVNADAARLQQVFWNLIKNAVKFTPEGGTITLRTRNEPGPGGAESLIAVEVSDTGIGIDPEVLPRIFDPFQQGETTITRRFGGLGLGLAICKGVVEAHGGTIGVESGGKGRGTTFRLVLKALPEQAVVGNGEPAGGGSADGQAEPRPLRILVVEDEPATLRLMARLLKGLGHAVTTAGTITSAYEAVGAGEFDLIVSDIGLPDGTGLELMRRVVALRGRVRSIALTGYGMEDDIVRSREAGFTAHMTKPIDFPKLEAMIRQVVS